MNDDKTAMALAERLDAVPETGADPELIEQAASELRRLHAEVERITAIADDLQAPCDRQALRIAALDQPDTGIPASVLDDWKLVPVEPNCSMVLAGERSLEQHDFLRLDSAYRAMLAAAPQPQKGEPAPGEISR